MVARCKLRGIYLQALARMGDQHLRCHFHACLQNPSREKDGRGVSFLAQPWNERANEQLGVFGAVARWTQVKLEEEEGYLTFNAGCGSEFPAADHLLGRLPSPSDKNNLPR